MRKFTSGRIEPRNKERLALGAYPRDGGSEQRYAERRALYGGFGEALAQAFEFAAVPVLFAAFGLWLDGRIGTGRALTVVLLVLGLVGVCVRTVYRYKAKVQLDEEGKPWTRRRSLP